MLGEPVYIEPENAPLQGRETLAGLIVLTSQLSKFSLQFTFGASPSVRNVRAAAQYAKRTDAQAALHLRLVEAEMRTAAVSHRTKIRSLTKKINLIRKTNISIILYPSAYRSKRPRRPSTLLANRREELPPASTRFSSPLKWFSSASRSSRDSRL